MESTPFSPKELEHKQRREQAFRDAANPTIPLLPRTRAFFSTISEGTLEIVEGAKREFQENKNRKRENNPSKEPMTETEEPAELKRSHSDPRNEENEQKEHQYREKRRRMWKQASDSHMTLTDRTKAGSGAIVAGIGELFAGGKNEIKRRKNSKKSGQSRRNSVNQPIHEEEEMPDFPDVPSDTRENEDTNKPNYVTDTPDHKTTINLDKDEVMSNYHGTKEAEAKQKRETYASIARDPRLPLGKRIKSSGKALFHGTKEFSEGARREYRQKNNN